MIYKTLPTFSPYAKKLRSHFDGCFADPRLSNPNRFVWDYWHIPNEYTFLRTPAFQYFSEKLYRRFHAHLVEWGREHLGCHDVSPTWLSYYVDGCSQSPHRDQPHGPLAFVLSLTKQRKFRGGNTIIFENGRKVHSIPPRFNQLAVFDPALVHGVDVVRGVQDPRKARLVLHGWFVNPRLFWYGKLTASQVGQVMDQQLAPSFAQLRGVEGFSSWRLKISAQGRVVDVRLLVETLKGKKTPLLIGLKRQLAELRFPKGKTTTLTLPLTFSE